MHINPTWFSCTCKLRSVTLGFLNGRKFIYIQCILNFFITYSQIFLTCDDHILQTIRATLLWESSFIIIIIVSTCCWVENTTWSSSHYTISSKGVRCSWFWNINCINPHIPWFLIDVLTLSKLLTEYVLIHTQVSAFLPSFIHKINAFTWAESPI